MLNRKTRLLFFLLLAGVHFLYAQEGPFITQQWFSRINHNPAAAGNSDEWDIFAVHRQQWMGFDNAPQTTMLNAHTSIDDFHSGVGMSLAYDMAGPPRSTVLAKFLYSYRINITHLSQLAFGLGAGIQHRRLDYSRLTSEVPGDPEAPPEAENKLFPVIDFGIEFLTQRLTIGASVTNSEHIFSGREQLTTFMTGTQYHGYAHYKFPLNRQFDLSPTGAYIYGNGQHFAEIGVTAFYKDVVWGGMAYRVNNTLAFLCGVRFSMFRVGYSYDHPLNSVRAFGATHEIVLSVRIPKAQKPLVRNFDGSYKASRSRVYKCR